MGTLTITPFDAFALVSQGPVAGEVPGTCCLCSEREEDTSMHGPAEPGCPVAGEHHPFTPYTEARSELRSAIGPFATLALADEWRLSMAHPERWMLVRLTHPVDVYEADRAPSRQREGA